LRETASCALINVDNPLTFKKSAWRGSNKGDFIVKFNSPIRFALIAAASILIASCGGGGAKSDPNSGGTLTLLPTGGIFYAGVAYTMTLQGGKGPFSLTSDDPSVLSVPSIVNGHTFDVVGNNPSVVDPGLPANALPVKTVHISARDTTGLSSVATMQVGRNFLTGYSLDFTSTSCLGANGAAAATIVPCAGGDTTAELTASISGNLVGDAQYTFEVETGTMGFVNPIGSNTVTPTYTTTSDHQGRIIAVIRVPASAPTQIGVIRVTHVASGVSTNYAFTITGPATGPLTALPTAFNFVGGDATTCGFGVGTFYVSGGTPPYTAQSSNGAISVIVVNADTGVFQVSLGPTAPPACPTGTIVVRDSNPTSTPLTVTVGATAGAPAGSTGTALSVAPTTLTLACGASGSVTVVGGSGTYTASSTTALMTPVVSSSTVTTTLAAAYAAGAMTGQSINISDGTSIINVPVTAPNACP
jgi:hypothetical protein